MSFLEMLDVVNERLIEQRRGADRVRSRLPRGDLRLVRHDDQRRRARPDRAARRPASCTCAASRTATRSTSSRGGRAAFPVIKDLVVDRGALDRIIAAGGFITATTGGAPDANAIPIPKEDADSAMDAAACIGCGACVAACPNGSASLFTARRSRTSACCRRASPSAAAARCAMVAQMDARASARCTLYGECQEACPKEISIDTIARMNRDFLRAAVTKPAERDRRERRRLTSVAGPLGARARALSSQEQSMAERPSGRRQLSRGSLPESRDGARRRRRGGEDDLRDRTGDGAGDAAPSWHAVRSRAVADKGTAATWAIIAIPRRRCAVLVYLLGFGTLRPAQSVGSVTPS